jgi:hypothetical protein
MNNLSEMKVMVKKPMIKRAEYNPPISPKNSNIE